MLGTLFNTVTVAIGAGLGLALRQRVPENLRSVVFSAIGLFTLYIGVDLMSGINTPVAVFVALVIGAALCHAMGVDRRVRAAADKLGNGTGSALVQSTLLFCVGAMTLVGCMRDGLENDPTILYAKGTMDLISSVFLAAALGRGVLYSAGAVLLLQGTLTLAFGTLGTGIPESMVTELSGLGGILLFGLGLDLLGVRSFPLLDLSCALPVLPFVLWLVEISSNF